MANIFDPQEFFSKTAYYGSQGRGLFTLTQPPPVLQRLRQNELVGMGWDLLSTGLVAKSINIAGYTLATFDEFSYIGPTRKHAHTQIFGPMTVEFLLMGQTLQEAQALHHTFLMWQQEIAGPRFGANEADRGARSDSTFFGIEYYDDYTSTAEVKIYSPQNPNTPIIWNQYQEIYPQALGGLSTSWESADAPLTLSVTFEFFHTNSLIR
jgi:hypothetical protein